jgi:hypothetical protein
MHLCGRRQNDFLAIVNVKMHAAMDRAHIEHNHVAPRYLAGSLSDEEAQEFERAFLADPSLVDDLELTAQLRAGLAELDRRGELVRDDKRRRALRTILTPYGLAASLIAAVALAASGYLYHENRIVRSENQALARDVAELRNEVEIRSTPRLPASFARGILTPESDVATLSAPRTVAQEISLDRSRDSDPVIVVTREHADQWIALTIDAMAFDNKPVSISLNADAEAKVRGAVSNEIWRGVNLGSPARGKFVVYLNEAKLSAGKYSIDVVSSDGRTRQQDTFTVARDTKAPQPPPR